MKITRPDLKVTQGIEQIRQDRKHGAGWLSRRALKVMSLTIEGSKSEDIAQFLEEIRTVGNELSQTRPNMAPIVNSISQLVSCIAKESEGQKDLTRLIAFARSKCEELIRRSQEAALQAATQGTTIIVSGDRLMTCSYSSTVCEALKIARRQGKQFSVMVAESKSSQGAAHGQATVAELRSHGISAEIIPDDAIPRRIQAATKIIVGADCILDDGTLINGTPTHRVAIAARNASIPFYAVCEMSKFRMPGGQTEESALEEGFDQIPPELITTIITERGVTKLRETSTLPAALEPDSQTTP